MEEGKDQQYDRSVTSQTNQKDAIAMAWAEKLRMAERNPEQVLGEFIAGGARMVNYVATEEMGWKPTRVGEHRKMILLAGNIYGSRWGAETLKAGLSMLTSIDGSKSFGTDSLCMVPYPRFNESGDVITANSQVFLFNGRQVQELQKLVGLTPTPQTAK